jgi:hypothetical protein
VKCLSSRVFFGIFICGNSCRPGWVTNNQTPRSAAATSVFGFARHFFFFHFFSFVFLRPPSSSLAISTLHTTTHTHTQLIQHGLQVMMESVLIALLKPGPSASLRTGNKS